MKYIKTDWDIPYYNMAFENYVMTSDRFDDSYVFFYIHKPSVIIGKHQNTLEEINSRYIKENNIIVSRRNTGGGAVYHDEGNLNFSFITSRSENEEDIDFSGFTKPVISALKKLGVEAKLSGRNDIIAYGRKISGNAQAMNRKKVLSHGTLLFDVNVEAMVNALNVSQVKIESKAIKSVRSRVLNLREHLNEDLDIYSFRDFILCEIMQEEDIEEYVLDERDLSEVERLVREKYSTWDFNYGYSPKFSMKKKKRIEGVGMIEAGINVKDGRIEDISISGDYFSILGTEELEKMLCSLRFEEDEIRNFLKGKNMENYISRLSGDEFADFLFE